MILAWYEKSFYVFATGVYALCATQVLLDIDLVNVVKSFL